MPKDEGTHKEQRVRDDSFPIFKFPLLPSSPLKYHTVLKGLGLRLEK